MKNVNINSFICKEISVENDILSFNNITDTLFGRKSQSAIEVDHFNIVVYVNIIQSKEETELFTDYECSMRLTSYNGKTTEVARFKLSDNIKTISKQEGFVCRNFAINKFYIPLNNYVFPDGEGCYILSILIRKPETLKDIRDAKPENDTQFMMSLSVKNGTLDVCNE